MTARRLLPLLVALGLMTASPASALTITTTDTRPLAAWATRALVPLSPAAVTIERGVCPPSASMFSRSCAINTAPLTIWLSGRDGSPTLYHELGHIFDYTVMTDAARAEFGRIVHDTRPWRSAKNSPHEKFAQAYEACAMHRKISGPLWDVGYGYDPSPTMYRRACRLIRRAAVAPLLVAR